MFERSRKGEHALLIQPHAGGRPDDGLTGWGDCAPLPEFGIDEAAAPRNDRMHAPLVGAFGVEVAGIGELERPAEAEAFEPWARGLLTAFDRCRVLCALRRCWPARPVHRGAHAARPAATSGRRAAADAASPCYQTAASDAAVVADLHKVVDLGALADYGVAQAAAAEAEALRAAEAARRGETITLVRNGSRGMFWLEPMVEVDTPAGRLAYGPVQEQDVDIIHTISHLNHQKLTRFVMTVETQRRQ